MKFAKYLAENSVPEWRSRYVNYRQLKKSIKKVVAARDKAKRAKDSSAQSSQEESLQSLEGSTESLVVQRDGSRLHSRATTNESHQPKDDENLVLMLEEAQLAPEEVRFFQQLDRELRKADAFFLGKEQDASRRLEDLRRQCIIMEQRQTRTDRRHSDTENDSGSDSPQEGPAPRSVQHDEIIADAPAAVEAENFTPVVKNPRSRLQKAFLEYYRLLELLKNFRIINQTSLTKILKKNEKAINWEITGVGSEIYLSRAKSLHLFTSNKVEDLIAETEALYTEVFAEGDRHSAMRKLRIPDLKAQSQGFTSWRTGLFVGLAIPAIALTLRKTFTGGIPDENVALILLIYGGFSIPIFFLFYYSMLLVIWARYHVNWVLVFELDPRDYLPPEGFSEVASILLFLFAYNMYFAMDDNIFPFIPLNWYPVMLLLLIIVILINPFNFFHRSSRKWFIRTLGRITFSGLFEVQFRDFFITDLLSSMTYMFVSMQILVCTTFHQFDRLADHCEFSHSWVVPFITAIPATWRLLQCLRRYYDNRLVHPHLTNAVKYCLSLSVVFISAAARINGSTVARVFWILSAIFASMYAYAWDVLYDWGLLQKNKYHKYLRKVIVYPPWLYMTSIGVNFLLRLSWVFLLSPNNWGVFNDARILIYVQALLELFRRFMWSIIRMENEHTNNIGKFRAVTEVPLPFRVKIIPHTEEMALEKRRRKVTKDDDESAEDKKN
ncbi:uncharacterized protein SPPG_01959 [Spizellomyces punctatus DAOM BR117]|uniref:EXS domain-containing protein n=1 Tax=Spizellomyces punctatus (strain DAOM BR117) TaxID=645134 RepID=A0A0L0HP93_SPIPD|nr:uncharacterized protein SPPG_01959 [Spizellomyces punctatus DAOM BR117]KND02878.1 hypothetical protein SPPG_01959 [Spizellomyces punctatus DAOM BR117]|eukprot:XP_016610917.1 hypothetical protein SPPG_01959 [Spizellomyces punctatus DAOM BR117]